MNTADLIVLAVLAVVIFFCVRSIRKNFKSGGCMGCPDSGSCHCDSNSLNSCNCGDVPKNIHIKKAKKQRL